MQEDTPMRSDQSEGLSRRQFVKRAGTVAGLSALGLSPAGFQTPPSAARKKQAAPITIQQVDSNFEREPLGHPYGFKGGFTTNIWQIVALMESASGTRQMGLGTQNVLWADPSVFLAHSENAGNALMYALTERALQMAKGMTFETPIDLQEQLLEEVHAYGKEITGDDELAETFTLNALVPVDHAAWLLYAKENGITDFDEMIPEPYRPGLSYQHDTVTSIPSFGYKSTPDEIEAAADEGYYVMKIKVGQPGTQEEMLEKDKQWLTKVHNLLKDERTEHTESGKLPYYLDANGRYQSRELVQRLLDHADKIGALEQMAIFEQPFPIGFEENVDGFGDVIIAADESAHTGKGTVRVIEKGYDAIALKPAAKTLSMTLKMIKEAYDRDVPCFCSDLTVNPILVDWNKNVAARLHPLPGFETGLLETNGWQNYRDWEEMMTYHPYASASWTQDQQGVFKVGEDFYDKSGGIFKHSDHYRSMVGSTSES